jgi:hypothetical protein
MLKINERQKIAVVFSYESKTNWDILLNIVSECFLFNVNSATFQLYHGEKKKEF